ncbi:hypothetical protein NC652_012387 [Populus alba x Populus x berolinensis]|nr:hypothetical protein NC652_012387 [Populus alba x Populus x berolinensis]
MEVPSQTLLFQCGGTSPSANPVREIPNSPEPPFNPWRNLFVNNRNTVSCPRLIHYSAFTDTTGCNLVDDDIDTKCELWKLCLVGYIAGRNTGFKALQNLIENTWKCGPYLVFGRPLILRAMPEYFDFSPSDIAICLLQSMARLSYARVLVEVNLLSDLPIPLRLPYRMGSILQQQVVYETLPRFCKHCRKLGHLTSSCTKFQPSNVPSKPRAKESACS